MATIRTSCPLCGDVDLSHFDLALYIYENVPARSYYSFRCGGCDEMVTKEAPLDIIAQLDGVVFTSRIQIPEEALEIHEGDPISMNDVLDMILTLQEGSTV